MRELLKAAQATLALGGLLFGLASQATNVAELPLKTSVLAKPNVVFAMDDSGSMDWEMALRTDNGFIWWSETRKSAWDSTNGRPLESSNSEASLSYLFPMGEASSYNGGQLYSNGSSYGRVAPPIAQLAWTRSSAFNPMYYNSLVTYPAWSPAYVSGAQRTYSNASTTAAPGHPGPFSGGTTKTLNLSQDWNATNAGSTFTDNQFKFWALPGMVLPSGTQLPADSATSGACRGSTMRTLTQAVEVGTGRRCLASIPYYPATFWHRTVCPSGATGCVAAPDCTVSDPATNPGSTCVNAPDGVGKLRRYEIRSGNSFPSGRSYADELQNFANWFTYYRKRKLLLAAAMGRALEPVNALRLGVVRFCDDTEGNSCSAPTMYEADGTSNASNRFAAAGQFYLNGMSAQGTPTHYTMKYIGGQFNTNTNIVQYACQRNSLFVVTDGFSNTTSITPPSWDSGKSASTWGSGAPYQTTPDGSQADLALRFFTNRLRASGSSALTAGKLPTGDLTRSNPDRNTDLHITTYAITLGARGTLYPTADNPFATDVFASPPTWPTPVADDPTMIDDLWHATINGRGQMYLATDADALRQSLQAAFNDILGQIGGQSGLAVTSINLARGDSQAYLGTYTPAGWAGDLTANGVNADTGVVSSTPRWSAASLLQSRDWSTRKIATVVGGTGVALTSANYSTIGAVANPSAAWGSDTAVLDYLRGSRSGEGSSFRARTSLMGAVINAEPVPSRDDKLIYMASGEGMLHAFDTETGVEHWAFIPGPVLPSLGQISSRDYSFRTRLDATPSLGKITASGKRILVGAMGGAGRYYYALDVSNPRDMSATALASAAMWQFPSASDTTNQGKMGYSYGRPVVAKTARWGDVVLVTSGYDNGQTIGDGKGRMWVLDASTGAVVSGGEFVTTDGAAGGAEAGLTHISAYREADGTVRHVYGGDLLGNLWHFDLTAGTTVKLATLKDASGNLQPITAAPELVTIANQRVVLIGTGRLLDITDFGSTRTQSFYAIADGTTLANARNSLVQRTYTRGASPELSGSAVDWATQRGWYFDLPAGEQANTQPSVAYGTIGFTTNVNSGSDCSQSSFLYLIDITTGLQSAYADFASVQISSTANASRLSVLRVSNGQLVGTSHTSDNGVFRRSLTRVVPIAATKNAWREIRR